MSTAEKARTIQEALELCRSKGVTLEDLLEIVSQSIDSDAEYVAESTSNENNSVKEKISMMFKELGIPAHLKGYTYTRSAILKVIEDPTAMECVVKVLYPAVAKQYGTTPSRVERAIRHSIEVAWDRGNDDVLKKYFGYTVDAEKGKPTNSEFIAMMVETIKLGF